MACSGGHAPIRGIVTSRVVTDEGSRPPVERGEGGDRLGAGSSSPGRAPNVPYARSAAVIHGQPRSVPMPAEL
jgi:hypothetical protein